jgi:hypothetical protein
MQTKFKRNVLGFFVSAIIVSNLVSILGGFTVDNANLKSASSIWLPKFKTGTKTYDDSGKWIGCIEGSPKNCLMMEIADSKVIDISWDGMIEED